MESQFGILRGGNGGANHGRGDNSRSVSTGSSVKIGIKQGKDNGDGFVPKQTEVGMKIKMPETKPHQQALQLPSTTIDWQSLGNDLGGQVIACFGDCMSNLPGVGDNGYNPSTSVASVNNNLGYEVLSCVPVIQTSDGQWKYDVPPAAPELQKAVGQYNKNNELELQSGEVKTNLGAVEATGQYAYSSYPPFQYSALPGVSQDQEAGVRSWNDPSHQHQRHTQTPTTNSYLRSDTTNATGTSMAPCSSPRITGTMRYSSGSSPARADMPGLASTAVEPSSISNETQGNHFKKSEPPTSSADRNRRKAVTQASKKTGATLVSLQPGRKSQRKGKQSSRNQILEVAVVTPLEQQTSAIEEIKTSEMCPVKVEDNNRDSSTNQVSNVIVLEPGQQVPWPELVILTPPPLAPNSSCTFYTSQALIPGGNAHLPGDVVSESEDEKVGKHSLRKCVVCLRRQRFTEDIYEESDQTMEGGTPKKPILLKKINVLMGFLKVALTGKPSEEGLCISCLDSLHQWHVFYCSVMQRHTAVELCFSPYHDEPLSSKRYEHQMYRNYSKMLEVKEVFNGATHANFTRRNLTDEDLDFFSNCLVTPGGLETLKTYIMSTDRLAQLYCITCQRLVGNGKKGFVKHSMSVHPQDPVVLPCDICGDSFPDKQSEERGECYFAHWVKHFYLSMCDECGERFPSDERLAEHRELVHLREQKINHEHKKKSVAKPNESSIPVVIVKPRKIKNRPIEDRPWKCELCDAAFHRKSYLKYHRDCVHLNFKKYACQVCGEAYKTWSALSAHKKRLQHTIDAYGCDVCQKKFDTERGLLLHQSSVHKIPSTKKFFCETCNHGFKLKCYFEKHACIKPSPTIIEFKQCLCCICGSQIQSQEQLTTHMAMHAKQASEAITRENPPHPSKPNTETEATSAENSAPATTEITNGKKSKTTLQNRSVTLAGGTKRKPSLRKAIQKDNSDENNAAKKRKVSKTVVAGLTKPMDSALDLSKPSLSSTITQGREGRGIKPTNSKSLPTTNEHVNVTPGIRAELTPPEDLISSWSDSDSGSGFITE